MLELRLFGSGQALYDNRPLEGFPNLQAYTLLCYLLLHRQRPHNRERLAALFWGDYSQERARNCLNTTLWRLRQVLEPEANQRGTYLLTTSGGEVGFNPQSAHWLDIEAFEEYTHQVLSRPVRAMQTADAEILKKGIELYTGELLEGLYDDWALHERERLRRLYMNSLAYLMDYYKQVGDFEACLACAQRILDQDPPREEIHREIMRLYLANGQRSLAVQQYQVCREVLATELGILPMEETQALYAQIAGVGESHQAPSASAAESVNGSQALQQLRLAIKRLDEARWQLQQAMRLVEQLTQPQDRDRTGPE
jgi:DNA-binding SARP family transcriptional activator